MSIRSSEREKVVELYHTNVEKGGTGRGKGG